MKTRRFIYTAIVALLTFSMSIPASGTTSWIPDRGAIDASGFKIDYKQGRELLYVMEEGLTGTTGVMTDPGNPADRIFCTDVGPKLDCGTGKPVNIGGQALLPVCTGLTESCIEKLEVAGEDGIFTDAVYQGTTSGTEFKGNASAGIPSGTSPAIYKAEVQNTETSEYAVSARMSFWYNPSQNKFALPDDFSLRVFGTKPLVDPSIKPAYMELCESTDDGKSMNLCGSSMQTEGCVYQDTGICGREVDLASSTSFRVTMILSNEVTGWFRGRLKSPDIQVFAINDLYSRVIISGQSVEVPRFISTFDLSAGDPDIVGPLNENAHGSGYTLFEAPSARAMEIVNGMRDKVKDTAVAISRIWSINSISGNRASADNEDAARCLVNQSKVLGIVTTNAVAYTGTIPDYDLGYLSYKVAGLHYAPNGKDLNIGTYDLVMRSETARCLYGFTKAPVSATVQVVGEQGAENIATTIVSEKDGWLKLAAYGFTFSEKEIQVKLTQPQNKTLTNFSGTVRTLSSKQKSEIKAVVSQSKGNPKFICTGVFVNGKDKVTALKRARAVCDYAKSLDKDHSYWAQAKLTKAKSYDAKVMVVSK